MFAMQIDKHAASHLLQSAAVAISANAMSRDIEVGQQLGFFRYLTKPIVMEEFMSTLDLALELDKP